jgi:hypothetical protein
MRIVPIARNALRRQRCACGLQHDSEADRTDVYVYVHVHVYVYGRPMVPAEGRTDLGMTSERIQQTSTSTTRSDQAMPVQEEDTDVI